MAEGIVDGSGAVEGAIVISLMFGLLILAATAPTTLAEERTRGSLDVLMATPLATREIVVAKWWGVYRRILVMLPLFLYVPGFVAATATSRWLVFRSPGGQEPVSTATRFLAAGLCPADFLASGALVVSIGVALATWVKRVGRAIVLSVIAFFLLGMVWPTVVEFAFSMLLRWQGFDDHRWLSQVIGALSPIGGPILPLNALHMNYGGGSGFWIGVGTVILIKVAIAWLLLEVTVRTFDRCLGRVPESRRPIAVSRPLPRP
jgi:ABC-type transport system involved in multi-copper enzyme maturation permease subunit